MSVGSGLCGMAAPLCRPFSLGPWAARAAMSTSEFGSDSDSESKAASEMSLPDFGAELKSEFDRDAMPAPKSIPGCDVCIVRNDVTLP